MASGEPVSSGTICHSSGKLRYSAIAVPVRRVSIGNSFSTAGVPGSYINSVGHMVVRPALEGSTRLPKCAKKMALMSSDLPRENSATKATYSLSSRSSDNTCSRRWSTWLSPRSCVPTQARKSVIEPASVSRQAL